MPADSIDAIGWKAQYIADCGNGGNKKMVIGGTWRGTRRGAGGLRPAAQRHSQARHGNSRGQARQAPGEVPAQGAMGQAAAFSGAPCTSLQAADKRCAFLQAG